MSSAMLAEEGAGASAGLTAFGRDLAERLRLNAQVGKFRLWASFAG